jgi:hypothetical protein
VRTYAYSAFHHGWGVAARPGVHLTLLGALLLLYVLATNIGWDRHTPGRSRSS